MSQILMKLIQKYCLQRRGYIFVKDGHIYVSFCAKSSQYFEDTTTSSQQQCVSRAVLVVTDVHTKLPTQLQCPVI